jgi:hypothetical protein
MRNGLNLHGYQPPTREDMVSWQSSMRQAFFEGVTEDDIRAIVGKLVADAKGGDKAAARIILSYAVGNPQVSVKQAVIVTDPAPLPAPLPKAPAKSLPGTAARVEDMAKRASRGQEIFDRRDRRAAE